MSNRTPDNQRVDETARVWGIWVPMSGVLPLITLRTNRRACIKEYTAFYTARTRPKLTWATLYRWGWRCIPVTVAFKNPVRR